MVVGDTREERVEGNPRRIVEGAAGCAVELGVKISPAVASSDSPSPAPLPRCTPAAATILVTHLNLVSGSSRSSNPDVISKSFLFVYLRCEHVAAAAGGRSTLGRS